MTDSQESLHSLTIVMVSDTHQAHQHLGPLPPGDLLVHAGDFTRRRPPDGREYREFIAWISRQKHSHKILISGNRDQYMDRLQEVRAES